MLVLLVRRLKSIKSIQFSYILHISPIPFIHVETRAVMTKLAIIVVNYSALVSEER
jgi:hypothetical protein